MYEFIQLLNQGPIVNWVQKIQELYFLSVLIWAVEYTKGSVWGLESWLQFLYDQWKI